MSLIKQKANNSRENPLTPKQALKKDARALAELIYDIYKQQSRDEKAANGQNYANRTNKAE